MRGEKGSLYEGGHREPYIARWPGHIPAGETSGALIGHVDTLATVAALTGQALPADAAPDSFNILPVLLGTKTGSPPRDQLVIQNNGRAPLALRQGDWMLIQKVPGQRQDELGTASPSLELYNLTNDLCETNNLAATEPAHVKEMAARLQQIREQGHSRAGYNAASNKH